ncbi:uncharacterized protein ACOB7L_023456 isoform 5-T5 [Callospermophilus lateralis]|uniref:uncharacterized protein LOC143388512 isoform X5 n=1 Tax=Callospermophilus lateralis TaxID=76772 RepID=UPI00405409EF
MVAAPSRVCSRLSVLSAQTPLSGLPASAPCRGRGNECGRRAGVRTGLEERESGRGAGPGAELRRPQTRLPAVRRALDLCHSQPWQVLQAALVLSPRMVSLYMSEAVCIQVDQGTNWGPKEHLKDLLWPRCATQAPPRSGKSAPVQKGMPEQQAQLPQTFRVLKGKPTEFPLAVRGVNKYYNASTLKQKKLRLTTPGETSDSEKDCFPSGTPALNTKGPETSAIVMEEDDGNGEVRPFTAPRHGHTRPGMPEQQAQLPQTFRVLKGKPTEFPLAVRGVNKYYNASTLKQKKLRLTTPEKDCFPSGTPALNTKGPETSAIVMEEDDGNGEVHPFTAPGHGHTRPGMPEQRAQLPQTFRVLKGKPTEHPLAVRGVNKYYNANTLKQKNLRLTTPEKDCFPSGTPALNTKGPETSAIVMEEDDGDGEVLPFTAPRHGHTRPLKTKGPETLAIIMEEYDDDGEVQP